MPKGKKLETFLVSPIETENWRQRERQRGHKAVIIAFVVGTGMTLYQLYAMSNMTVLVSGVALMCLSSFASIL